MLKKFIIIVIFTASLAGILTSLFLMRKEKKPANFIRSVTALRLVKTNPTEKMKLTGTVEAWKEEDLSFEVPGRINWVIDKGSDVQGSSNPYSLSKGDGCLIATLAPEEYELKLKAAKANLKTTRAQLNALKINVLEVISRQLEAAKADMDNAEKEFNRMKNLKSKNVISERVYDTAETTFKKFQAKYSEIKASIVVKGAEMKAVEANLEQLTQAVADAKLDLKRTKLRVPYQGKIADVYANIGANVKAGEKVARLVVVDPITVKLNISPALDRKFHYCQFVNVYPPDSSKPIPAMVNRKAAVADPNTHTFSLELLVRNKYVTVEQNLPKQLQHLPPIKGAWPIGKIGWHGQEKLVVITESIYHDAQGDFVWKIEETPATLPGAPVYRVKKERVTFLTGEHNVLGVYKYRILDQSASLKEMDFAATGVPENLKTDDKVILIRKHRMFRPGDLVKVVLSNKQPATGFYVPLKIICSNSLKTWVFKVVRQHDGSSVAKQVFVNVKGHFNDRVLIESPLFNEGDKLVFDGSHFIIPNEKINVKSIEKVAL